MYEIDYNPKFIPIPSPKVNVKSTIVDGKPSFLMKNHATGIYYDLDEPTNLIWNVTDGKKTVRDIVKEVQRQKPETTENTVIEILLFFAESNLLTSSLEIKQKKRFRAVSPFEIDFTLVKDSHKFVNSLHTRIRPIFKGLLLWVSFAFIIACAVLFAGRFVSIYGHKSNFEILGSSVVGFFFYYFIALAPIIAIHEIAHAITLVHYGGRAGEMGTGLFYFSPMFYTETTDAWGLSRHDRMMVYLAGNISTLLIGSALFIAYLTVQIPGIGGQILLMIAFYCFSMSLMNFAPPFETDGYYLLSDIVNMPNLRQDSYGYLGSIFRRAFRACQKRNHRSEREKEENLPYLRLAFSSLHSVHCFPNFTFPLLHEPRRHSRTREHWSGSLDLQSSIRNCDCGHCCLHALFWNATHWLRLCLLCWRQESNSKTSYCRSHTRQRPRRLRLSSSSVPRNTVE